MLKKIHSVAICVALSSLNLAVNEAVASETGLASYYADRFQGRKTASGQQYDRNKLTAAHKTLPIGSKLEVINPITQNSVIVTVNDRGPYVGNRTLDLSYAAAKELGLVNAGVAPVVFDIIGGSQTEDFEKVIPVEYAPGVLVSAKSEEEIIEAEEEFAESNRNQLATAQTVESESDEDTETQKPAKHSHKAKKMTEKSEKDFHYSESKPHSLTHHDKKGEKSADEHHAAHSKKEHSSEKTAKSDKHNAKHDSKSSQHAKAEKSEKSHPKSKKSKKA